jgi:tetratricopeptide (TPR) repeat protein
MSGELRPLISSAIFAIVVLNASPILIGDRTLAQDGEASVRTRHAQSDSLHNERQGTGQKKVQATGDALFNQAQDLAGRACSLSDLELVVEKYQEFVKLVNADARDESVGHAYLQLGRFSLYLKKYDDAEAALAKALKIFATQGDGKNEEKVLSTQVVLHIQKNQLEKAVGSLEQALRVSGTSGDPGSQAGCVRFLAKIYEESQDFAQSAAWAKARSVKSRGTEETGGEIKVMTQISRLLRASGMHEKAEQVSEQSLGTARAAKDKRWEASALVDLANVYKDRGQYDRALVRYLKALKIYEELGDLKQQAWLMNSLGRVLAIEGKYQEAEQYHEKALKTSRDAADLKGEAVSLGGLGSVYRSQGHYAKAAECHEKSLEIVRKIGDVKAEAYTLDHLGNVLLVWGQYAKAADCFEKSLAIRRQLGHAKGEAVSLRELGRVYQSWGQLGKALKYLEQSLEITRKIGDVQGEATGLNQLGEVCRSWGQYDRALEYFQKSLEITQKIGDVKGEAASLHNLGRVYRSWGQFDKALECFEKSLEITRKIGDVKGEAASLNDLGKIHQSWGQYDKAMACYEKSLEITRKIGDAQGEAAGLRSMGIVSTAVRKYGDAAQYYENVLIIEKKLGTSTALTSALLAQLYMDMGDLEKAEVLVQESKKPIPTGRLLLLKSDFRGAKEIYEKSLKQAEKDQHWANLFVSYTGLGMATEGLGDYTAAAENYRHAIRLTEKERDRLSSGDRDTYFDVRVRGLSRTAPYEGMARVLVMMNQQARAFRISELGKARAFAEAISRKPSKIPLNVPVEVVTTSRQLAARASELESRREKAVQYGDKELLEYLEAQIRQVDGEIRTYRQSLREKFPVYAATRYPTRSLPLKESAIRDNEWVLSYDATDSGLLIYLIHGQHLIRGILKPVHKTVVEDMVRKFRTPLVLESSDDYQQRMDKLRSFDFATGKQLADLLLGDVLPDLPVNVPVIIVPDDSLADLPFEMLVLNDKGRIVEKENVPCAVDAHFFGDRNPVSYYQSVTALTLSRTFGKNPIEGNRLLVVADPVTDPYDARITTDTEAKFATAKEVSRKDSTISLLNGQAGLTLGRLLPTRDLAEHLKKINGSCEMLMGFDASKQKFLAEIGPRLNEFKYIVFATHGSYGNTERGITEPVLCLTLIPEGTDGLLRMSEVMGLKLNADLVALTACQSGLGKKVPGEGIMGMGRAFQYAGARSVLMSLWSVQATASTKLVETFYANLLQGKDKLQALTLARKEIRDAGFDHPFFWAGLILTGETD